MPVGSNSRRSTSTIDSRFLRAASVRPPGRGGVHGERVMDPVNPIRLIRADGSPFVGESARDSRRNSGQRWTIVGVVREGRLLTDDQIAVEAGARCSSPGVTRRYSASNGVLALSDRSAIGSISFNDVCEDLPSMPIE